MWNWSPDARAALATSHTVATRVDVLHGGNPVYQLEAISGQVSSDANRPVRANLSCTLVDPTGALTTGDVDDLLDPYECEIAPWRGVRYTVTDAAPVFTPNAGFGLQPFGTSGFGGADVVTQYRKRTEQELAPLGVFGLTSRQVSDGPMGLTIRLTGQDRAMAYQVPMANALAIPGNTSVEQAIVNLLAVANPTLNLLAMNTGHTVGPLLYPPDIDVWAEAQELADSVGARLYHDRTGQCVLMPSGASYFPVASYGEGDGLLLSLERTEDSDTIRNVVIAESVNGMIRAVAYDDDPSSPTFAGGRYGFRPIAIANQHFSTVEQAQQAASGRLVYELGRAETVSFTAVPDPGLDVDDVVTVNRPRAGLEWRGLVVDTVDMPLGAEDTMQVGCRRSVLAQDGAVLEESA